MAEDRILVVDDDPDNRAMTGHFLCNGGYDIDDAKKGKVALEEVAPHPPQLVEYGCHLELLRPPAGIRHYGPIRISLLR